MPLQYLHQSNYFASPERDPLLVLRTLRVIVDSLKMNRQQLLDLYFLEARSKLIDLAAFLDRVDRAPGQSDFRLAALRRALEELNQQVPSRAEDVLLALSDPTTEAIPTATTKAASGDWPGN